MTSTDSGFTDRIPGYFQVINTALDAALPDIRPLGGMQQGQQDHVVGLAMRAVPEVAKWARAYPIMGGAEGDSSRVVWTCLHGASVFPDGPLTLITDCTALILTAFSWDDILDGVFVGYSIDQLTALTELAIAVGEGRPATAVRGLTDPERQVMAAYRDCFTRITAYPAFTWAAPYLARHWRRGFEAMLQESRWRLGVDSAPDLREYLVNAVPSAMGPLVYAALVAMSDLQPQHSHDLDRWDEAAYLSTLAIRLCNDLRTAERERAEGTPNAADLIIHSGQTEAQATNTLLAAIDVVLVDLASAIDALPAAFAGLGSGLRDSTRFACDWYLARDTHGLTTRQLRQLLREDAPE